MSVVHGCSSIIRRTSTITFCHRMADPACFLQDALPQPPTASISAESKSCCAMDLPGSSQRTSISISGETWAASTAAKCSVNSECAPDCIGRSELAFSCCLTGLNDASGLLIQSFTAQPETPASTKAGTSDWAVNSSPPDATKSTVRKPPATCVTKTGKHRRARALTLQN